MIYFRQPEVGRLAIRGAGSSANAESERVEIRFGPGDSGPADELSGPRIRQRSSDRIEAVCYFGRVEPLDARRFCNRQQAARSAVGGDKTQSGADSGVSLVAANKKNDQFIKENRSYGTNVEDTAKCFFPPYPVGLTHAYGVFYAQQRFRESQRRISCPAAQDPFYQGVAQPDSTQVGLDHFPTRRNQHDRRIAVDAKDLRHLRLLEDRGSIESRAACLPRFVLAHLVPRCCRPKRHPAQACRPATSLQTHPSTSAHPQCRFRTMFPKIEQDPFSPTRRLFSEKRLPSSVLATRSVVICPIRRRADRSGTGNNGQDRPHRRS